MPRKPKTEPILAHDRYAHMKPGRYAELCWTTGGGWTSCMPECVDLLGPVDLGDVLRRLKHEARCGAATGIRLSWMGRLYSVRPKNVPRFAEILPRMVAKAR